MSAPEKHPVRVTICNQTFTVRSSAPPEETLALAQRVDDIIHAILRQSPNVELSRASLLACLHLADELTALEREISSLRERVTSKSREFSLLLDQAVDQP